MASIRTIPIRKSGNRPNLFMGGDREMVQLSLLFTFVLVVAPQNKYAFIIGIVYWVLSLYFLRKMAKADPLLRQVGIRSITSYKRYYGPRATPFRDSTNTQANRYK